jgi:hypothetical protein
MFIDQLNNDFRLQTGSPCIGTGRDSDDRGALPYIQTGITENEILPENIILLHNYPNPFNASTTISYNLAKQENVIIDIYDMLGRKIETLLNSNQPAGDHSIIWNADNASSGIYFYKLSAGESVQTKRMILLK